MKQINSPALVFLVAGQSNAGGRGVLSPDMHRALGRRKDRPLTPGTTAAEIGLATEAADFTHSCMWVPGQGFQHVDPRTNLRATRPDAGWHGIELPVLRELEKLRLSRCNILFGDDLRDLHGFPSGLAAMVSPQWSVSPSGCTTRSHRGGTRPSQAVLARL